MTVVYSAGQFDGPDLAIGLIDQEFRARSAAGHYLGGPVWALDPAEWSQDPFVAYWLLLTTFGEENVLAVAGEVPKGPAQDPMASQ